MRIARFGRVAAPPTKVHRIGKHCGLLVGIDAMARARRAPALDDLVQIVLVADRILPLLGKLRGRGARQAVPRKFVEFDTYRQRHAVAECDRFALTERRQKFQKTRPGVRNCRRDDRLVAVDLPPGSSLAVM